MSNVVGNIKIIQETQNTKAISDNTAMSFRGNSNNKLERTPSSDNFNKKKSKSGETIGIITGLAATAALILGCICYHKGGNAPGSKGMTIIEKIKAGWRNLLGKAEQTADAARENTEQALDAAREKAEQAAKSAKEEIVQTVEVVEDAAPKNNANQLKEKIKNPDVVIEDVVGVTEVKPPKEAKKSVNDVIESIEVQEVKPPKETKSPMQGITDTFQQTRVKSGEFIVDGNTFKVEDNKIVESLNPQKQSFDLYGEKTAPEFRQKVEKELDSFVGQKEKTSVQPNKNNKPKTAEAGKTETKKSKKQTEKEIEKQRKQEELDKKHEEELRKQEELDKKQEEELRKQEEEWQKQQEEWQKQQEEWEKQQEEWRKQQDEEWQRQENEWQKQQEEEWQRQQEENDMTMMTSLAFDDFGESLF